jgi:hypothetical protein
MKKLIQTLLFISMVSAFALSCSNVPGADLKLFVVFDRTKELQEGASVDYAQTNQTIGKVEKISFRKDGKTVVQVSVFPQFKGMVRSGAMFIVDSPFLTNRQPRILMDILSKDSDNPPIKSGTTLNGVTWVFYKMTLAADTVSPAADFFFTQSKTLLMNSNYLSLLKILTDFL